MSEAAKALEVERAEGGALSGVSCAAAVLICL
jgi:hypothetical protein